MAWNPLKQVRVTSLLLCDQSSLVDLYVKDYKSLCAEVTIGAAIVNIQTHRQIDRLTHTDNIWPAYMNSSAKNYVVATVFLCSCYEVLFAGRGDVLDRILFTILWLTGQTNHSY